MKHFFLLTLICSFRLISVAQVQFAAASNNTSVSSFSTDGTSDPVHVFNIIDPTNCDAVAIGPDGNLYGNTHYGGSKGYGAIFSVHPDGNNFKIIHEYRTPFGSRPVPAFGPDGKLYFVLSDSLFAITLDGSPATFISTVAPYSKEIMIDKDGWLYGYGDGSPKFLFRIKIDGTGYAVLHNNNYGEDGIFNTNGSSFCLTPSGRIFLTCARGVNGGGTLVSMRTDGSDFIVHKSFSTSGQDYLDYGSNPGDPIYRNGKIYLSNIRGAGNNFGALLSFDTFTNALSVIYAYNSTGESAGTIIALNDQGLAGLNNTGLFSIAIDGTNFEQLNAEKAFGYGKPVYNAATDKLFYTATGGVYKNCYLLKTDAPNNTSSNIHSFGYVPDGYEPDGITRAPNGLLYGINQKGGSAGGGTLFKMNSDGSYFAVIKDFNGDDGQSPFGQLLAASDGRLYGVCKRSGINGSSDSLAIYGINIDGTGYALLTTLSSTDYPVFPELAEGSNGLLFGISGARYGSGSTIPIRLFSINKNGTEFKLLSVFNNSERSGVTQGLVAANGYIYGITASGGTQSGGTLFRMREDGLDFSVVKNFSSSNADGIKPNSLMLGRDNKLYGVTSGDYFSVGPTIYSFDPANLNFKLIKGFSNSISGYTVGKLAHASNNRLYLYTYNGIFGIDPNGSNETLDLLYMNVNSQQVVYLTEIPYTVATALCPPAGNTSFQSTVSGSTYQWQVNTGNGFTNISDNSNYIGTSSATLIVNNVPSSWNGYQYRCVTNTGNGNVYTIKFNDRWTGAVNTSWENPANWSCALLPDSNTDVVIITGTVVINSNVIVKSLTIKPGATLTVNTGFKLTVLH